MELLLIELVLWAGLVFFFWVLMSGLDGVEINLETYQLLNLHRISPHVRPLRYERPEQVMEAIGSYSGVEIYRYAVIGGVDYQFDHILPRESNIALYDEERCLVPGLVYVPCRKHINALA